MEIVEHVDGLHGCVTLVTVMLVIVAAVGVWGAVLMVCVIKDSICSGYGVFTTSQAVISVCMLFIFAVIAGGAVYGIRDIGTQCPVS